MKRAQTHARTRRDRTIARPTKTMTDSTEGAVTAPPTRDAIVRTTATAHTHSSGHDRHLATDSPSEGWGADRPQRKLRKPAKSRRVQHSVNVWPTQRGALNPRGWGFEPWGRTRTELVFLPAEGAENVCHLAGCSAGRLVTCPVHARPVLAC